MTFSFFFSQSAGFLIQLFPCMVLCFMPFEKASLRIKPHKAQWTVLLFALAASAAFPFILRIPGEAEIGVICTVANLYMLAVLFLFMVSFAWAVRESLLKKGITVIMVIFYAVTQYLLVNMLMPRFDESNRGIMIYPQAVLLLYVASTAVLLPFMVYLMGKVLRVYMKEIEPSTMQRGFASAIAMSLCYFGTVIYYASTLGFTTVNYWWVFCPPFLFAAVTLMVFYLLLFREAVLRKRESEHLRQEKVQEIQYQKLLHDMESASRMRHDARHHYRTLYEMAVTNHDDVAVAYLADLIEQTTRRESVQYCLNPTINALLQYYIGWAQDEHVHCQVQADCDKLEVTSLDLSTMIGNTLENAIAACKNAPGGAFLRVEIARVGCAQLAIRVENSCGSAELANPWKAETGFLPAEAFLSASKTGGYGLRSIAMAAQRYNGEADFCFDREKHTFISRIRLRAISIDEAMRSDKG